MKSCGLLDDIPWHTRRRQRIIERISFIKRTAAHACMCFVVPGDEILNCSPRPLILSSSSLTYSLGQTLTLPFRLLLSFDRNRMLTPSTILLGNHWPPLAYSTIVQYYLSAFLLLTITVSFLVLTQNDWQSDWLANKYAVRQGQAVINYSNCSPGPACRYSIYHIVH